nr:unnamed protein product [Callosobruchus chinensis]
MQFREGQFDSSVTWP